MIAANVHALLYIFFKISSETKRTTHICQPHKCSFRRWYWELKSIVCRENMSLYSWELEGKWKMKALDLAGWPKRFFFSFRFLSVLFVQCQHWQQKYYFLRCWWWILALRTLPGGLFKSKTLFFKKKNFKILVWVRVNIRNGFRKPSGELWNWPEPTKRKSRFLYLAYLMTGCINQFLRGRGRGPDQLNPLVQDILSPTLPSLQSHPLSAPTWNQRQLVSAVFSPWLLCMIQSRVAFLSVVLNQGWLASTYTPGDMFRSLKILLVVTNEEDSCCLVGRGQGCCWTPSSAQDNPHTHHSKEWPSPKCQWCQGSETLP